MAALDKADRDRRAQKQSATLMTKYTPEQRRQWGLKGAAAAKAARARKDTALSAQETEEG